MWRLVQAENPKPKCPDPKCANVVAVPNVVAAETKSECG
jgi:hypothetical protein